MSVEALGRRRQLERKALAGKTLGRGAERRKRYGLHGSIMNGKSELEKGFNR
ncbi:MAG: hypothetical protein ANABAC_1096 [Anaerolineae bacterium]|nr:MAG: hypothetical protein ANABAC_1096 [Anaerolineae bacterium]